MKTYAVRPVLERLGILDGNEWLIKKLDPDKRRAGHLAYMFKHFRDMNGGTFVDLGPGAGEALEIAQSRGATAIGFDAATGEGGMGNPYLSVCRELARERGVDVRYVGALMIDYVIPHNSVDFINSRGSIEQILCGWMNGSPHHTHQNCNLMKWKTNCRLGICGFLQKCANVLKPGGTLLIHANGAANTDIYDLAIESRAPKWNFKVKKHEAGLHRLTLG